MFEVAQIQMNPRLGECGSNLNKIKFYLDQSNKADLVVLPELANSGYMFENRAHAMDTASESSCLIFADFLRDYAVENKLNIVSGYLEKQGGELFNSSIYVSKEGDVGKYRKIHLFMDEKKIFSAGNLGLPIFNVGKYKLGMLICFDYLFPEVWRIMALKGADIIAHPSNLITRNAYKTVPAQAIMNGYYTITSNRIGTEDDITFCGNSFICDPRGNVISEMDTISEGVSSIFIDPLHSRNKMITSGNHILEDRCPDNYSEILS